MEGTSICCTPNTGASSHRGNPGMAGGVHVYKRHLSRYVHQVVSTHFEIERALIFRNEYVGLSLLN